MLIWYKHVVLNPENLFLIVICFKKTIAERIFHQYDFLWLPNFSAFSSFKGIIVIDRSNSTISENDKSIWRNIGIVSNVIYFENCGENRWPGRDACRYQC